MRQSPASYHGLSYDGRAQPHFSKRAPSDHIAFSRRAIRRDPISVSADQATCNLHVFVGPWSKFSDCDRAQDFLTKSGLSFKTIHTPGAKSADLDIAGTKV
ncbi:MAG: hypothetical protein WB390_11335, partial [Pseudolabrys sp.]